MDVEDNTVFTDAMELHYIDMKAFVKAVNEADSINDTEEVMFVKWLSVITQKEIANKAIIENACEEEEILMAVSALARQSEDKILRQAYQRRKDEIYFNNMNIKKLEQAEAEIERLQSVGSELEQAKTEIERLQGVGSELERAEAENEKLRQELAEFHSQLNKK